MSYKFLTQPLTQGVYEPEGIYLSLPLEGEAFIIQFWGEHAGEYSGFRYHGVALKGHPGLDFATKPGQTIVAVDQGRVMELGEERNGIGRYLKVEHTWGESLYGHIGDCVVDAGQQLRRGALIAYAAAEWKKSAMTPTPSYLHFGIRIKPYNRFDGWGGFVDPLPYLNPTGLRLPAEGDPPGPPPHPMVDERPGMRRP
ncbi:MAG: M23 family metallopeptidase [Caldilineaceae bacterium]